MSFFGLFFVLDLLLPPTCFRLPISVWIFVRRFRVDRPRPLIHFAQFQCICEQCPQLMSDAGESARYSRLAGFEFFFPDKRNGKFPREWMHELRTEF